MSRFDRVMARRLENVTSRLRPREGHPHGVIVHKQHIRGDRWWRMRYAEIVERRKEQSP